MPFKVCAPSTPCEYHVIFLHTTSVHSQDLRKAVAHHKQICSCTVRYQTETIAGFKRALHQNRPETFLANKTSTAARLLVPFTKASGLI